MRVLGPALVLTLLGAASAIGLSPVWRAAAVPLHGSVQAPRPATTVVGTVVDGNGAGLARVTVDLVRSGAVVQTTATDSRGAFRFDQVAPGVYDVRARRAGLMASSVKLAVTSVPAPPVRLLLGIPEHPQVPERSAGKAAIVPRAPAGPIPQAVAGGTAGGVVVGLSAAPPPAPAALGPAREMAAARDTLALDPRVPRFNTEAYSRIDDNPFRRTTDSPVSTFSIDVDTASYANVRRFLNEGRLPPKDAVRTEELINYFRFEYPNPTADAPVAMTTEVAACPWNPRHALALIGIQARREAQTALTRNLVFLLDVSGSMMPPDKLPLVQAAMRMLVNTLTARDRVAIVVYAGASGLALPSTPGDRKEEIHAAIAALQAGGSTNGAEGIRLAYDTAAANFVKGGVNRVILATDGDFNVGVTSQGDLVRLIEEQRERGIFLSVLGVGTGNLKDSTMELLADRGNGNYAYLDSLQEARRVLIEEAGSTLVTVAKDVKIQVEFNPRTVAGYRLVGYENRMLNREDFNDDRKDAGEMGAGHAVTALYEVIPAGQQVPGSPVDPLIYQETQKSSPSARRGELMTVKLRYKEPDGVESRLLSVAVKDDERRTTSSNIGFASAVAQFGMLLRDSDFKGEASWASTQTLAREHVGPDPSGRRSEFVRLLDLAAALRGQGSQ